MNEELQFIKMSNLEVPIVPGIVPEGEDITPILDKVRKGIALTPDETNRLGAAAPRPNGNCWAC